jgi:hypothetical protein
MVDKLTPATRKHTTKRPDTGHIHGRSAAQQAHDADHLAIDLPVVGTVLLPRPEQLAYYGAVGILLALEIIDWPIALLVVTGHALAQQQHNRAIQQFGEGLEDV